MRISALVAILFVSAKLFSQIEYGTSLHFKATFFEENRKNGKIEQKEDVFYKVDLRNGGIYPYIKVEPNQEFYVAKDPYKLSIFDRTIFGELIDESFEPGETKEKLFTLQEGQKIEMSEPADYLILFLGTNISSEFIGEEKLEILDFQASCYKFKINDYPAKGYSYVYINKSPLVPVKFETFEQKKKGKGYFTSSSIEIYKMTY